MKQGLRSKRTITRYLLGFAVYAALISMYFAAAARSSVPSEWLGTAADPAVFLTEQQLADSQTLNVIRNITFFISYPWEWGIYLILLIGGFAASWQRRLEASQIPRLLQLPAFVFALNGVSMLAFLPLSAASYTVSVYYGITTQPLAGWIRDKLVSYGINSVILTAVTAVAFLVIRKGGRWWLKLWLLSVPFTLFMMVIQPVVIDPLYNNFSRLNDAELESRILELAHRADIPADRVYEVQMSAKTNALNAYVNGIGPSLRIVLWDTTLQRLEDDEILLIMAHEIGHYVKRHLEWSAVGSLASSFIVLWLGSRFVQWLIQRRGRNWGVERVNEPAALPLILLLTSIFTFVSLPVTSYVSRQAEQAADVYAYELIGSSQGAVTMHQKLASSSLGDVNPPWLAKLFRSTHPSTMERIIQAEQFAKEGR